MATAPGKLNIFFKVGPIKGDGYHDVVSVYQALNLRERVIVSASHSWQVGVSGSLPAEHLAAVPTDDSNLVVKAAKLIGDLIQSPLYSPAAIGIDKQVPVAGGMGGGSADAAAAAVAVNSLWSAGLSNEELVEITAPLGADVPFAVLGGTALGIGVGEQLTPIENVDPLHWVMIPTNGGLSTPTVFKRLDELRAARGQRIVAEEYLIEPTELLTALSAGNPFEIAEHLHNDLQEASVDLMPSLATTILDGERCGALKGMVSGSGPTVALLCGSEEAAVEVASQMRELGYSALATSGPAEGARVEI
jgi:4-diphosphocytidyl-2-C-methyl-D-erythritol kinase